MSFCGLCLILAGHTKDLINTMSTECICTVAWAGMMYVESELALLERPAAATVIQCICNASFAIILKQWRKVVFVLQKLLCPPAALQSSGWSVFRVAPAV